MVKHVVIGLYSGEQPLNERSSCLLSSVNLAKYVINPFQDDCRIDFFQLEKDVYILNRMMDNVVEHANLPLEGQQKELIRKRRHGLGFLGLGSMFSLMKLQYGSDESVKLTKRISKLIAYTSIRAGIDLAKEKGPAPIMEEEFEITPALKAKNLNIPFGTGQIKKGKELLIYSDYMMRFDNGIRNEIFKHGMRFSHATSVAPTGTMALGIGNNVSNGIEPSFSHEYFRNIIKSGKKTKEQIAVYSYEALLYKHMYGEDAPLPDWFSVADSITPLDHIKIQAAAQPWIDSSISKTINCPTDIKFEEFENIYMESYDRGLKSATTFRFNPERFQGVLVTKDNLENTKYQITFEDGTETMLTGDTKINYQEDETTVANLYDALKEGYYGKF
jgi:ribonucleoside-diphosphate reductase alpha chain